MKKILLIPLFFITIVINGQTFDFYNKKLIGDSCKIENKNFTFVIKNINTFKYNVLIDNKPVNFNQDIPDLIKEYLLKVNDSNTTESLITDSNNVDREIPSSKSIDVLKSVYFKLKTSEQFYNLLVELLSSDLPYNKLIDFKKSYFRKYIGIISESDESDISSIVDFYSKLINEIPLYAISLKAQLKNQPENAIVDSILKNTNKINSLNIPMKIASLYYKINEQSFSVYTFIPQPNADDLIVNITAKPNSEFNKVNDEIKIEVPFNVKGGFKLDFSTGFFLSNVANKEYVNKPNYINDSINGYYLFKSEDKSISYGLAGYMHAYWRNAANINVGLSLGVGIDQNTQVKIMPGISILLGRKERFIINGGMVIGKIKELSNVQDVNHLYKEKVEPVYIDSYKIGCFVGISYNLSK
jgi:hypothetical protein